jgi:general secretion pathway protein A
MYLSHFGLQHEPFSIAPDPQFLFMSQRHQEALAHLRYGLQGSGGFVVLTGEIGAGKTTLCRSLMEQVPADCELAYLFNPKLSERELLQSVCADFGIAVTVPASGEASLHDHIEALNQHLLATHARGHHSVLIVDEAQALSPGLLEQLRLLTNLETNQRKLLQIVLVGQPELRDMLARPELEQLSQRVVARYHLPTLSATETEQYVRHRLTVAGLQGSLPFDAAALARVHQRAAGVPRRINLLCDRALLGAYAAGAPQVRAATVDQAAREVFGPANQGAAGPGWRRTATHWAGGLTLALLGVAGGLWVARSSGPEAERLAASPASSAASVANAAMAASAALAASAPAAPPPVPWLDETQFTALAARASTDEAGAWRDLAMVWLLTPLSGEPCAATAALGVPCHKQRGTLALLRQLGRPALLPLYGPDGVAHFARLLAVSDAGARLQLAGQTVQVGPQALSALWRGEFGVLWRAPPGYLPSDAKGPARLDADWLDAQLARWESGAGAKPANLGKAGSPAALRARVRHFQRAQGLGADGLTGALTLMQLNRATGVAEPQLAW